MMAPDARVTPGTTLERTREVRGPSSTTGEHDLSPRGQARLALLAAAVVPALVAAGLHGGWILDPQGSHPVTAFGASHVWGLDHIARMLTGQRPLSVQTVALGFPSGGPAPTLGWAPALLALPFRPLLGPLGAYAAALLATVALAGAACHAWLRAAVGASPWAAAVGGVLFATSPAMLNNLALGNIDKLSVWVYPAWLWLAWAVVQGRAVALALVGAGLVAFLAPMSEPYLGLFLPLVGVPLVGLAVLQQPAGRRVGAAWRTVPLLALTAAAMLPARAWFSVYAQGLKGARVFRPASVTTFGGGDGYTQPWAPLPDLVHPGVTIPDDPERAFHVFYVGLAGLLGATLLVALPGVRRRAVGAVALLVGLLLVIGPNTVLPESWPLPGPRAWLLPATILERLHYPTAVGGQYYRALPLVGLGVAALAAAGLSARRGALAVGIGLLLPVLALADGLRATAAAWPRPLREVPCRAVLTALAQAPGPGAVLNTRLRASQARNGEALMLATLHGRPVNTLPLQTMSADMDAAYSSLRPLLQTGRTTRATGWLRDQGFRFLLVTPLAEETLPVLHPDRLAEALGPATWDDGTCQAWDLDPPPAGALGPLPAGALGPLPAGASVPR